MSEVFFKMMPKFLKAPKELSEIELRVMLLLCFYLPYQSQEILLDGSVLDLIAGKLEVSPIRVKRILKRLEEKKYIVRRGFYIYVSDEFGKKGR